MQKNSTNQNISFEGKEEKITTIGVKIIEFIYKIQKKVTIDEIGKDTGLKYTQIQGSLAFLHKIRAITKDYENLGARRRIPPRRKLYVFLTNSQIKNALNILKKNDRL